MKIEKISTTVDNTKKYFNSISNKRTRVDINYGRIGLLADADTDG